MDWMRSDEIERVGRERKKNDSQLGPLQIIAVDKQDRNQDEV